MIRLFGLASGILSALLLLYLATGTPAARAPIEPTPASSSAARDNAPLRVDSTPLPVDSRQADIAESAIADAPAMPSSGPGRDEPAAPAPLEERAPAGEPPSVAFAAALPGEPPSAAKNDARWCTFWSPFRTAVAANGFIAELQRTTGLDYRVARQAPGDFEVAFACDDDADAARKLALIAAASGIDATAAR